MAFVPKIIAFADSTRVTPSMTMATGPVVGAGAGIGGPQRGRGVASLMRRAPTKSFGATPIVGSLTLSRGHDVWPGHPGSAKHQLPNPTATPAGSASPHATRRPRHVES